MLKGHPGLSEARNRATRDLMAMDSAPEGSVLTAGEPTSSLQSSSYGYNEPFKLTFLESQEKVQLMLCIEEFLDEL